MTPTDQLEARIADENAKIAAAEVRLREARDSLAAAVAEHVSGGSDTTKAQDKLLAEIHGLSAELPERKAALLELEAVKKAASRATRQAVYNGAAAEHAELRAKIAEELNGVAMHFAAIAPAATRLRALGELDFAARERAIRAAEPGDLDPPLSGIFPAFRDVASVTGASHESRLADVLVALDELQADAENRPPTRSIQLAESYDDHARRQREALAEIERDLHDQPYQARLRERMVSNVTLRSVAEPALRKPDGPRPQPRGVPYRVAQDGPK